MTSLIDVIFLLLLFFMLSSTFTRFAEIDLTAGGSGGGISADQRPVFIRLGPDFLELNGQTAQMEKLRNLLTEIEKPSVLVSLQKTVTAQRLTDLLVALREVEDLQVTVLEQS